MQRHGEICIKAQLPWLNIERREVGRWGKEEGTWHSDLLHGGTINFPLCDEMTDTVVQHMHEYLSISTENLRQESTRTGPQ